MAFLSIQCPAPDFPLQIPDPRFSIVSIFAPNSLSLKRRRRRLERFAVVANGSPEAPRLATSDPSSPLEAIRTHAPVLVKLFASAVFFIGTAACALANPVAAPLPVPVSSSETQEVESSVEKVDKATEEDEELKAALEAWKSKTFALTVPLRIVALHGSIPPSWIKEFIQCQGKRLSFNLEYRGGLASIFSELSSAANKGSLEPKSAMAADVVSLGDSWISYAISMGLIEPIKGAKEEDWFKNLSNKWKVLLCRNDEGELDSKGHVWGVPYRWGTMVILYKKSKFKRHNLKPIEDWGDLWRPELAGKISMVHSSREVIGAVLKHLGAPYNVKNIDEQVVGGKEEVLRNLTMLQKQVLLFDSNNYLKAFTTGDVWVAVGWSSDVISAAKRLSNVAVVVPKSGTSIWSDLWVVPYATKFTSDQIGGRVRGPSPLIHQWLDFCLQTARGLPFLQEVVPGSPPVTLESSPLEGLRDTTKGGPKLDTNLIDGIPPPDILAKCEFLEPLSEKALADHEWLISNMQKPGSGFLSSILKL